MSLALAYGLAAVVSGAAAIPASSWILSPDDAAPGAGIVATPKGVVYFVDRARDVVWRLEEGTLDSVLSGRNTRALQLTESGELIAVSRSPRGAEAWRIAGGEVAMVARGAPGLGLAIDQAGCMYGWSTGPGTDSVRVWRAEPDGRRFELAGGPTGYRDGNGRDARFFTIGAMTLAADGSVLLTSGPTIRRVAPDGRVTTLASGSRWLKPRASLLRRLSGAVRGHLAGIATDGRGTIYVANSEREVVARVAGGRASPLYHSPRGWHPVGVAASAERVYVLEYGRGVRVAAIEPGGRVRPLVELGAG